MFESNERVMLELIKEVLEICGNLLLWVIVAYFVWVILGILWSLFFGKKGNAKGKPKDFTYLHKKRKDFW